MEEKCYDAFNYGRKAEAIRILKKLKDPRRVKVSGGGTLLHLAAIKGWRDVVATLINDYDFDVNCKTDDNWTPVHLASSYRHVDVVKYLCSTGKCNLFIKNKFGNTAMDIARLGGYDEIVELITNALITSTLTCK